MVVVYNFFFTFSAEEVSDGENEDGDNVDLCDIFDDPAVKEQLLQNDLECELEQQGGTTLTVTVDVHAPVTPKTEHVDVGSKDISITVKPKSKHKYLTQTSFESMCMNALLSDCSIWQRIPGSLTQCHHSHHRKGQ